MSTTELSHRVQMAIIDKKTTVSEVARKAGISRLTVYKILNGKSVSLSHLLLVLEALSLKIEITEKK